MDREEERDKAREAFAKRYSLDGLTKSEMDSFDAGFADGWILSRKLIDD